jgi:hypothetical protein
VTDHPIVIEATRVLGLVTGQTGNVAASPEQWNLAPVFSYRSYPQQRFFPIQYFDFTSGRSNVEPSISYEAPGQPYYRSRFLQIRTDYTVPSRQNFNFGGPMLLVGPRSFNDYACVQYNRGTYCTVPLGTSLTKNCFQSEFSPFSPFGGGPQYCDSNGYHNYVPLGAFVVAVGIVVHLRGRKRS